MPDINMLLYEINLRVQKLTEFIDEELAKDREHRDHDQLLAWRARRSELESIASWADLHEIR